MTRRLVPLAALAAAGLILSGCAAPSAGIPGVPRPAAAETRPGATATDPAPTPSGPTAGPLPTAAPYPTAPVPAPAPTGPTPSGTSAAPTHAAPTKAPDPAPRAGRFPTYGNAYGGLTFNSLTTLAPAPTGKVSAADVVAARKAWDDRELTLGATARPQQPTTGDGPLHLIVYVDFSCPHCQQFEEENGDFISTVLNTGEMTVEYRLLSYIETGTRYSQRAANLVYCAADTQPQAVAALMPELYALGPDATDEQLVELAAQKGAPGLQACVADETFEPYATVTRARALQAGIPGTPTVFLGGKEWDRETNFQDWVKAGPGVG